MLLHLDDLKISHVDPEIITGVIGQLEEEFGTDTPLTKTQGKIHEYLGMTLAFTVPGTVKFTMTDYIKGMLEALLVDMNGEAVTPAANHLFEISPKPELLHKSKADMFHHNVAKLLFLCKQARSDIQTAVAFLCTRVKAPDADDYKKLTHVMRYL